MSFFGLFKKKEPEDYEQILSSLAIDIQKRQAKLADIRRRERRTTTLVTLYAIAAWITYIGAWYLNLLPHAIARPDGRLAFLKWVPILLGPILVQLIRRIVQTWYERIGNSEEKTLKKLLSQQHNKVEEIKKKTNYYTTKNLIDKYDTTPTSTPVRQRPIGPPGSLPPKPPMPMPMQHMKQQQGMPMPMTPPQKPAHPNGNSADPSTLQSPMTSLAGLQGAATPMTPARRTWYDRFADALLGDDDLNMNNASTRYALICQKCFSHNGLVKEEELEDAQFRCMKCNHFNPSKRSLKSGSSLPPTSAALPSFGRAPGPRQSALPSELSFDSAVSSPNFDRSVARPRPSVAAPKPPSPLANVTEFSEGKSVDLSADNAEDEQEEGASVMDVDS